MSSILVIMFLAIWRVSVHRGSSSEVFLGKGVQKIYRSNPPEVFLGKGVLKICQSNPPEVLLRKTVLKTFSKRTREFTRQLRLKSHFGMGVLPQICCIFSEHLFLRALMVGCLYKFSFVPKILIVFRLEALCPSFNSWIEDTVNLW